MANCRRLNEQPSRLRPAILDPLDSIGLVSKGDTSLLDFGTQERYYDTIESRYHATVELPKDAGHLESAFESLSLSRNDVTAAHGKLLGRLEGPKAEHERSVILLAMRKLREALVATSRMDAFTKEAYIFIIRSSILMDHPESYHPALLHLLRNIRSATALTDEEVKEFAGYHILDLACRQNNLAAAYTVRHVHDYRKGMIEAVLRALVSGDWVLFWKMEDLGNAYEKRLMRWVVGRMRSRAIDCLGKSYLSARKDYVEKCTKMEWNVLKTSHRTSWTLDGDTVIIKQMKKR